LKQEYDFGIIGISLLDKIRYSASHSYSELARYSGKTVLGRAWF